MSHSPLPPSKARSLAGLMKLNGDEPAPWAGDELGAILRHQLVAPLEYDLRTLAPGGEKTIMQMSANAGGGPRPRNFGDLLHHPAPPLELLRLMKDFARSGRENGALPPEVATVLYYASIVVALMRQNTRITELDNRSLQKGVEWALTRDWLEENVRRVFEEATKKLA